MVRANAAPRKWRAHSRPGRAGAQSGRPPTSCGCRGGRGGRGFPQAAGRPGRPAGSPRCAGPPQAPPTRHPAAPGSAAGPGRAGPAPPLGRAGPVAHHHRGYDGEQGIAVSQQPVRRLCVAPQLQLQPPAAHRHRLAFRRPAAGARHRGSRSRHGPAALRRRQLGRPRGRGGRGAPPSVALCEARTTGRLTGLAGAWVCLCAWRWGSAAGGNRCRCWKSPDDA